MSALVNFRLLGSNRCSFFRHPRRCQLKNIYFMKRYKSSQKFESDVNVVVSKHNGKSIGLSTGKLARLADGCAVVSMGDTAVMATVVSDTSTASSSSFLPLVVDYRQKASAAGRIPTNFLRRELGMSQQEILTSRLIDRSVRPLFPENYRFNTQIMCNMLALDGVNDPDIAAINAASAALSVSDIPWDGPVGAVRVGMIDEEIIINPTRKELQKSSLNLTVAGKKSDSIVMLEGSADNIPLQTFFKAVKMGAHACQNVISGMKTLRSKFGKKKRSLPPEPKPDEEIVQRVRRLAENRLRGIFLNYGHDKISRDVDVKNLRNEVVDLMKQDTTNLNIDAVIEAFNRLSKETFRALIFEYDRRCDGRRLAEVRQIDCQVNLFQPLHGSSLFQRGQTQVLCTVTLDSLDSAMKQDTISMLTSGLKEKNFFLHYEFPPYATNETGKTGTIGRRELGHGALAERGLRPILPKDYPFTVRLTSEVLESNGSSSMATICGGTLALLDAGVPITDCVAGVAIGLVTENHPVTGKMCDYRILTDILGIEDYLGDMDFKIAGTKKGLTAVQADIKIPGLPTKIVSESIRRGYSNLCDILNKMQGTISTPRTGKENMPVTETLQVPPHQRGKFLGVGGFNLKKILVETGVTISPLDENTYTIFAPNKEAMTEAKEIIDTLLTEEFVPELEFGGVYTAKVVEIRDSGVMVTLYPNMKPALLRNSQLDQRQVSHASALQIKVDDEIQVKYFGRDPATGTMRLSRKVLQGLARTTVRNFTAR